MSLFSLKEICKGCVHASWHDCCGNFCHCKNHHENDVNDYDGSCGYKVLGKQQAIILPNIHDILGSYNTWPLVDILKKLTDAADILLHKKDYDGGDWEEIETCYKRGKEIIKLLENK